MTLPEITTQEHVASCVAYLERFLEQNPAANEYVYFISDSENIKIGYTTRPAKRVTNLQSTNSKTLKILAVFRAPRAVEGYLHFIFRERHVRGEWFEDAPEIHSFLAVINHLIGFKDEEAR